MNNTEQITKSGKVGTSVKVNGSAEKYIKTKLGLIPESWKIKSLGQIGVFSKGKGINKSEVKENGLPCIRYAEIYTKYQSYTELFTSFIDEEEAGNSREIEHGDLLFAGSGETLEDIGKCIAYMGSEPAFAGGDIVILRPKDVDSKFLGVLLNQDATRRQMHKLGQGHSVVHIYSSGLKNLKVSLPTLPEQQKIAKILSTWDKAITAQEKLIAVKERFKKGLMQVLLTGTKRFDGFDDDWEELKLNEVCSINPKNDTLPEKFIYIDLESVENGQLQKENEIFQISAPSRAQRLLKYDDILYQTVRPYQKNNLHFKKKGDYVASTGYAQVRAKQSSKFLYQFLHDNGFVNQVLVRCTGTSYPSINTKDLAEIRIKIPTEEEQIKIASILSKADEEMELLKQELINLEYQKRGLMQQLLTGAVRVKTT